MHTTASCVQHPNSYQSFLSNNCHHHYLNNSIDTNNRSSNSTNSTHLLSYNTGLDLLSHSNNNIKQLESDDGEDNQSLSSSLGDTTTGPLFPFKKRPRAVPPEEKNAVYYHKRARNNDSAKRSRDSRRIKEQQIQARVTFLEHENLRLSMENQTIRYKISQLHALYGVVSKPLQ